MTAKYPRWVKFRYIDRGVETCYTGCMNNAQMILEAIHRLKIQENQMLAVLMEDKQLERGDITQLFALYYKHQQAIEEKDEQLAQTIEAKYRRNQPKK